MQDLNLSDREKLLLTNALYILENQCYGDELHHEVEDELDGVPNPDEIRALMNKIKGDEDE